MGVKHVGKHPNGKVDSALTAQHIGEPNRKHTADNPYGAGEQSGKWAKPNARSAAANTRARAAEERGTLKAEPLPKSLPLPASLLPSASLPPPASLFPPASLPLPFSYMPTLSMHMPGMYTYYPHPPMSQPIYSHSQEAPMAPPYYPPYMFLIYSYPPQM